MLNRHCSLILLLSAAASLFGQSDRPAPVDSVRYQMPEVFVTANRRETDAMETNRPLSAIPADRLWSAGVATASEAAAILPGAASPSVGPWTGRWSIRGLSGSRVLLLVDGLRLDILRGYGEHPFLVDADQIVRIEVIRGPASVLYGSDAVAGVVNLITGPAPAHGPRPSGLSGRTGVQYLSANNQWNGTASVRADGRKASFSVNAVRRTAGDLRTPMGRLANTAFRGNAFQAEAVLRPGRNARLTFRGHTDRMDRVGVPADRYAEKARFNAYDRDRITAEFDVRRPKGAWKGVRVQAYGQKEYRSFEAWISGKPKGAAFVEQAQNADRSLRAAGFSGQSDWVLGPHVLIAGGEAFKHRVVSERIADLLLRSASGVVLKDPPPDRTPPLPRLTQSGAAAFVNAEFAASRLLSVQAGSRVELFQSRAEGTAGTLVESDRWESESNWSGNAGVLCRPAGPLRLFANIGRAFRSPDPQERYFRGPGQAGFVIGDPELRSETSLNLDAGLKWKSDVVEGELALFRNRIDRLIVLRTLTAARDTFAYANVGRGLLTGGEISVSWTASDHVRLGLTASSVEGRDETEDRPLPGIPPLRGTLSGRLNGEPFGWTAGADLRLSADRKDAAENELKTGGAGLLDLHFGCVFRGGFTAGMPLRVSLSARNVLDRSVRDPLSGVTWWDGPGRDVVVGMRTEW
ncbi:MAG: TonB-dependent receptor [bacterium]|nr:TonB-dependent receptor [bacterium]